MTTPTTSGQRPRTCRCCGRKYEYPVKGCAATRHHCADCVDLKPDVRATFERLNTRVTMMERQLARLQPPKPPAA